MESTERNQIVKDLNAAAQSIKDAYKLVTEAQEKRKNYEKLKNKCESLKKEGPPLDMTRDEEIKYGIDHVACGSPSSSTILYLLIGISLIGSVIGTLVVIFSFSLPILGEVCGFWGLFLLFMYINNRVEKAHDKRIEIERATVVREKREKIRKEQEAYNRKLSEAQATYENASKNHEEETLSLILQAQVCSEIAKEIVARYEIPESYQNPDALSYISDCFAKQTVDSFKEAYNRLMDKQELDSRNNERIRIEQMQREFEYEMARMDQQKRNAEERVHRMTMEQEARRRADSAAKAAKEAERAADEMEEIRRRLER